MQAEKLLQINTHFQLQWEEKQDCYVLLYPEGMVQLSLSAGEILNLCDGKNTLISIKDILEKKFDTNDLEAQVLDFLKEAMSRKWVVYYD